MTVKNRCIPPNKEAQQNTNLSFIKKLTYIVVCQESGVEEKNVTKLLFEGI